MRRLFVALCLLTLGGCLSGAVTGQLENGSETLTGHTKIHLDGTGEIVLSTSTGANCNGTFAAVSDQETAGTFKCSDGRSGSFRFVTAIRPIVGTGDIGGQPITLSLS